MSALTCVCVCVLMCVCACVCMRACVCVRVCDPTQALVPLDPGGGWGDEAVGGPVGHRGVGLLLLLAVLLLRLLCEGGEGCGCDSTSCLSAVRKNHSSGLYCDY